MENLGLMEIDGDSLLVQILNRFEEEGQSRILIRQLTNNEGQYVTDYEPEIISGEQLISDRPLHDINPKVIYHYSSHQINHVLKASIFVVHGELIAPISSNGLGSGIYGLYYPSADNVQRSVSDPDQIIYPIPCNNPFIIQDGPHGYSLSTASMTTNRFLDSIMEPLKILSEVNESDIIRVLTDNDIGNLVTLWNIVLSRALPRLINGQAQQVFLNENMLRSILANYIWNYFHDSSIIDSFNGDILHVLPINTIMNSLGYDSILASDPDNNSWGRGCISFNFRLAPKIEGYRSRIQLFSH